ncbi:MAG: amidohydrolase family protein [Kordiimonadaceae bacterium]|nr:amidohydrolase family protein [Kordiimonadaceae bacterium]
MKVIWSLLFILILASCSQENSNDISADILITGGTVFDGHDSAGEKLDIAINGDQITFVGPAGQYKISAARTIDASGMIVAPGFIDPHTHSLDDLQNPDKKLNANYLMQGVTTVFNGNDGGGPSNISETLDKLEEDGIGSNTALFVGQGNVRQSVMQMRDDEPTYGEMEIMKSHVRKAMEEGALGLSTGLYYAPGSYSSTEEVAELAKEIAPYDGIYESHIRDESTYNIGLLGAIKEVIDIARIAGIKGHVGHIKALGVDVWGQSAQAIKMIEDAQAEGLRISADQYPWTATGTSVIGALLPRYVQAGGNEAMLARLKDPELLPKIKADMEENMRKRGGKDALLLTGGDGNMVVGRTLGEEADARGKTPIETAIEIIIEGGSNIANFAINEDDLRAFMQKPWVMTSSDGSYGHPRKFATFPNKYRTYVVEKKYISLQDFIHRSTGLTADTFKLCDRGYIEPDKYADIVIFDPDEFGPKADYINPRELSVGVKYLLVNGGLAIDDGALTGELYGRGLTRCTR